MVRVRVRVRVKVRIRMRVTGARWRLGTGPGTKWGMPVMDG